MTSNIKLILSKILHTIIWLFFNGVIFSMLYAAITSKLDIYLWAGYTIIFIEGLVLFMCKNVCPVTMLARKYSKSTRDNFDIYLPNWLAKFNKEIYTGIVVITIFITLYQALK